MLICVAYVSRELAIALERSVLDVKFTSDLHAEWDMDVAEEGDLVCIDAGGWSLTSDKGLDIPGMVAFVDGFVQGRLCGRDEEAF